LWLRGYQFLVALPYYSQEMADEKDKSKSKRKSLDKTVDKNAEPVPAPQVTPTGEIIPVPLDRKKDNGSKKVDSSQASCSSRKDSAEQLDEPMAIRNVLRDLINEIRSTGVPATVTKVTTSNDPPQVSNRSHSVSDSEEEEEEEAGRQSQASAIEHYMSEQEREEGEVEDWVDEFVQELNVTEDTGPAINDNLARLLNQLLSFCDII